MANFLLNKSFIPNNKLPKVAQYFIFRFLANFLKSITLYSIYINLDTK